mgnify:CR=1 FL=1
MATTRLMPLHTGKGRTVGQAISDIIDYTENPQKTDGGRLNNKLAVRQQDRRCRVPFRQKSIHPKDRQSARRG